MSARVVVVVPWLPDAGCPYRVRNWRYCCNCWEYPTTEAHGSRPWVKARAVDPELRRLDSEIVIVADADVVVASEAVREAVEAVDGGAPWAIPHTLVRRLTDQGTEALMRGAWPEGDEPAYTGIEGGGVLVARRTDLLEVPFDPRFVGWGQEDDALGVALRSLVGEPWRGAAKLYHLWHPPQARMNRRRGSVESWRLRKRYYDARTNRDQMLALVGEACDALSTVDTDLHDHAPAGVQSA